jgi:hypothetical protein
MRTQRVVEQLSGQGRVTASASEPFQADYELVVRQWMHIIESRDGVLESPGTFSIEATLSLPSSAVGEMIRLFSEGGTGTLLLQDGRQASFVISSMPELGRGAGGALAECRVSSLDGH